MRPTADILGVHFHLIPRSAVLDHILAWRGQAGCHFIMIANPHSVMLCRRDPAMMAAARSATLCLPDGVGVTLAADILRHPHHGRVTGPALMLDLCDRGRSHNLRHFFYGGAEDVANQLAAKLTARFPGLIVAGTHTPPFRDLTADEEAAIRDQIHASRADILWVGLGAPKQEKWIHRQLDQLTTPAVIGVGAAFDFHSGHVKWAPAWIRKAGLEWAYRLALNPRRMLRRNLDSPVFLAHVLAQRLRAARAR